MRIISGRYKGYKFKTYAGSNTRPTTDLAKESIFNSLQNITDFEGMSVVDLFAGTGNIGLEFLSRGASTLTSVDMNKANIRFMNSIQKELDLQNWNIVLSDALMFFKKTQGPINILFADPPYDYAHFHQLIADVTKSGLFLENGMVFILEHADKLVYDITYLHLKKQYGNTCFSIFMKT